MGAAILHDLPVRELARVFDEAILVDLFHLWPARWLAFMTDNTRLEVCDLTAPLDLISQGTACAVPPDAWLDDPDIDFVVSANVASQLPLITQDWLASHFEVSDQDCK